MFEIRFESFLSRYKHMNRETVSRIGYNISRIRNQTVTNRVFIRESGRNNCQSIMAPYSLTREYNERVLSQTSVWDYVKRMRERER